MRVPDFSQDSRRNSPELLVAEQADERLDSSRLRKSLQSCLATSIRHSQLFKEYFVGSRIAQPPQFVNDMKSLLKVASWLPSALSKDPRARGSPIRPSPRTASSCTFGEKWSRV